jgi:SAM-dependent methyltransferase
MASIRKKLTINENDSKNTRMNIASAGVLGNWRPDELTHISRFDKISSLCIEEAKELKRPIDTLEIGCGELWVLRNLYKAYTVQKSKIISSYHGLDIDPAVTQELPWWSNSGGDINDSVWLKNFNARITVQDLTVNPKLDEEDNSKDFCWSTEVIEHMKPEFVPPWLDELDRVLRPNGLIYISTPNHDGSNDKLPEDHVYEWGFRELETELTSRWELQSVVGTFIQMPKLRKEIRKNTFGWSTSQFELLEARYGRQFLRMVAAVFYPEVSNNCAWVLRKKA